MKLIIAEKPSVARAIAAVVGADQKKAGYLEGNGHLVSWAVGHLVELEDAAAYGDYSRWHIEDLPIVPERWRYRVSDKTADQFAVLRQLMHRADVDRLICATDAGREGELIFRLIYNQAQCTKPFDRLWASSLEEKDLHAAMAQLRPGSEYDNLYAAALLRQQADWLVGINYSRFLSCLYHHTLSVGRVQTPVLQMIVSRQKEIKAFQAEPYYILTAQLGDLTASTRVQNQRAAKEVVARCQGQEAAVTLITPEQHTKKPPLLFSLSTLQGEANTRLGLTAQQTLVVAQSLYEKKLITYPRTNSNYIPTSIQERLPQRLRGLGQLPRYAAAVGTLLAAPLPVIADNDKVTDHHAIIPTMGADPRKLTLSPAEQTLFDMVAARTVTALAEPYCYTTVTVHWDIAGEAFKSQTRSVTQEGWRAMEQQLLPGEPEEVAEPQPQQLHRPIGTDEVQLCTAISSEAKKTQPPKPFTDRTLLEAMKSVGRRMGDEELKAAIAEGLGTEATRAGIIERLIAMGVVQRDKKALLPTDKGCKLLEAIPWTEVKDPAMTAEWELMLGGVERGELEPNAFLAGITKNVAGYIESSKAFDNLEPNPDICFNEKVVVGACPCCKGQVLEGVKGFFCESKDFAIWKDDHFFTSKGKEVTTATVTALLAGKSVELKGCTSKNGHKYGATVKLEGVKDGRPQYAMSFMDREPPKKKVGGKHEKER